MYIPRAYRHDIRCPECVSNRMPQNGASQDRRVVIWQGKAAR